MITKITNNIKVGVVTLFKDIYLKNSEFYFAFNYIINIENNSNDTVQLITRHWEIYDSLNILQIVEGEGVIGKKPIIKPGESYTYTSGCIIHSTYGSMKGYFNLINYRTTNNFRVIVPTFKLSVPYALN